MSGHHSRLMRLESSLFILPDLLQQRSSEFGGLVLEEFIGQGSFGRVYKGSPLRNFCPSIHLMMRWRPQSSLSSKFHACSYQRSLLSISQPSVCLSFSPRNWHSGEQRLLVIELPHGSGDASHAGSWRGGTVAVKVLCHEGSRTAKLNALHESVVCAHVQHPNVVSHLLPDRCAASRPSAATTLHMCSMRIWRASCLTHSHSPETGLAHCTHALPA